MEYVNFAIKIEPAESELEFRVLLIDSPTGQDRSIFHPVNADAAFAEPLDALRTIWSGNHGLGKRSEYPDACPGDKPFWPHAQKFGDSLFKALFRSNIRTHLYLSLGLAKERKMGLRIRLHFDPRHPQLAHLLCLPWEFLFDASENHYLNLDLQSPVVRYLDIPKPTAPPLLPAPLRILLVWAMPKNMPFLKISKEKEIILKRLHALPGIDVYPHGGASLESLRGALRENQFHVIHFMGHGGITGALGAEGIFLEDENGEACFVSANQLASCISGLNSLRFVFLNACQFTLQRDVHHPNPFTNTAAALLLEGIPAVLAMQAPIGDSAALKLASLFYERLARGEPIETSLTEARLGLYAKDPNCLDWAAPVLYLRNSHGHLFPTEQPEKTAFRDRRSSTTKWLTSITGVLLVGFLVLLWIQSSLQKPMYRLRSMANPTLSLQNYKALLVTQGFFDAGFNPHGDGLANRFEEGPLTIADQATSLAWQKGGSRNKMTTEEARTYMENLNQKRFEGKANWRLPTIEEALSLMEREIQEATHFIDHRFHPRQYMILTCDTDTQGSPWLVSFREGRCAVGNSLSAGYVRAVHSLPRSQNATF